MEKEKKQVTRKELSDVLNVFVSSSDKMADKILTDVELIVRDEYTWKKTRSRLLRHINNHKRRIINYLDTGLDLRIKKLEVEKLEVVDE